MLKIKYSASQIKLQWKTLTTNYMNQRKEYAMYKPELLKYLSQTKIKERNQKENNVQDPWIQINK